MDAGSVLLLPPAARAHGAAGSVRRPEEEDVPIVARFTRPLRAVLVAIAAAAVLVGGFAGPTAAAAPPLKVVVVVGPVGGSTSDYLSNAKALAKQARDLGANVTEIYTPHATWSAVSSAAKGANILIYLGHGNGWPSPYAPFQTNTKDGLGLNPYDGSGNSSVKYYGEGIIATDLDLADGAVVILNRLCYASGNSEWGWADPAQSVAKERIDNYGAGFLKAGASVVLAEAIERPTYALTGLLTSSKSMRQIFWSAPKASGARDFEFSSTRTSGAQALSDPTQPGKYWRSMIGDLELNAERWRAPEPSYTGVSVRKGTPVTNAAGGTVGTDPGRGSATQPRVVESRAVAMSAEVVAPPEPVVLAPAVHAEAVAVAVPAGHAIEWLAPEPASRGWFQPDRRLR